MFGKSNATRLFIILIFFIYFLLFIISQNSKNLCLTPLGKNYVHVGYIINFGINKKIVPVTMAAKGTGRGWQKYLWVSPMEQTKKNGEAVSSNKSSKAHYAG